MTKKVKSGPKRTTEDIRAELLRVADWKARCPYCGGMSEVAKPQFDLARLRRDPEGAYADEVMEICSRNYPKET